jgi:hypothetical protein
MLRGHNNTDIAHKIKFPHAYQLLLSSDPNTRPRPGELKMRFGGEEAQKMCKMALETPDLIHKRLHRRKPLRRSREHFLPFYDLHDFIRFDTVQHNTKDETHGDALDRFSSKHGNWCLEFLSLYGQDGWVYCKTTQERYRR